MPDIGPLSVWAALRGILRDPVEHLVRRWNWKSALTSAIIRAAIFFSANLTAGWRAAAGAMGVEFVFRILTSGFYGSVTEAMRKARPAWLAFTVAMILLPVVSHVIEFIVHWTRGTPKLARSIVASMIFTAFSTLFNLYAMQRGVLIVGAGSRSFWHDMKTLPSLIVSFLALGPVALWRVVTRAERRT